jgi:Superinfection immunity protein
MIGSLITTVVLGGITVALIGLYLLPVLLAWARHVPDIGSIAVINILLGWTLAGWVVALALALRSSIQPNPTIQLVQHLPTAAPPLMLPPPPEEPEASGEGDGQQW